jgi:hypothetical protein
MNLPTNTTKVSPENKCDVCKDKMAVYYNLDWYIHFCSIDCFNTFVTGYNKEIDDITIERLTPDNIRKDE